MTPSHTRKRGKLYRYYTSTDCLKRAGSGSPLRRVPAADIEAVVVAQIKTLLQSPEIVVATWRAARQSIKGLTERAVRDELFRFEELWNELFPAEQARIVQLLVEHAGGVALGHSAVLPDGDLATLASPHVSGMTPVLQNDEPRPA